MPEPIARDIFSGRNLIDGPYDSVRSRQQEILNFPITSGNRDNPPSMGREKCLNGHTAVCPYKFNEGGGVRLCFLDNDIAMRPSNAHQQNLKGPGRS